MTCFLENTISHIEDNNDIADNLEIPNIVKTSYGISNNNHDENIEKIIINFRNHPSIICINKLIKSGKMFSFNKINNRIYSLKIIRRNFTIFNFNRKSFF